MINKSAKSVMSSRWKYGCLTIALFTPLLSGCSSDDMMSLFGNDDASNQIKISDTNAPSETAMTVAIDSAACGLFFDGSPQNIASPLPQADNAEDPIALQGKPADDLRHAIALDLSGEHAKARRLYLWLTAADPNASITISCGNSIMLAGTITSLAHKRIKAMDAANPALARSREIDTVVASAIVAPGPELPDPPTVQRNRDFYKNTIAVNVQSEDSTTALPAMRMDVSSNTARLTSVDRSAKQIAAPSASMAASRGTTTTVTTASATTPGIIKGDAVTPSASNKALLSTTRPVESGSLELADEAAATNNNLIEVPMVDTTSTAATSSTPATMQPEPDTKSVPPSSAPKAEPMQPAPVLNSYYTVQLAAYRSREMAESRWLKFETMGDGILRDASHEVHSIAIEGQGLFFRLMTGQYASQSEAQAACNGLKRAGIDCLIRHMTP
ncbi:SPOR domain-containing protein [Thalassospiraceae bacterium SW-3-3]|nr:SPOR domain-containing protein [Thalassospiraceae bacterium SW-3-3]